MSAAGAEPSLARTPAGYAADAAPPSPERSTDTPAAAAAALAAGGAVNYDGDRMSVTFPSPSADADLARSVAPMLARTPADAAPAAPTAPAPAPPVAVPATTADAASAPSTAPAPPAATSATAPAAAAAAPIDPEELYEQVMRRFRREILHERELRGELF